MEYGHMQSCGSSCIYKLRLTGAQQFYAHCRVVHTLYILGMRIKKKSTGGFILKLLEENRHLACDLDRLDEENVFSIVNLFEPDHQN